jgi:geranylgeranyl pyrophosphate synthase
MTETSKPEVTMETREQDPFQLARPSMRRLKQKIKIVIDNKLGSGDKAHPLLKSSSRNFFERSEKTWRPMVPLLLSKAFRPCADGNQAHYDDAMVIAEIVEIMHTSTVIHDTVLEDYEALDKGNVAHRMYSSSVAGNKVSILAGDFLLSRASVLLSSLRNTDVVEIMAGALEAIMKGQMQLHRPDANQGIGMQPYVASLETRAGNLLACGSLCAALVAGFSRESKEAKAAMGYGMNVGIGYQMVKDLAVTEANYDKLFNKMQRAVEQAETLKFDPYELNEPLQRAGALMYAADLHPELKKVPPPSSLVLPCPCSLFLLPPPPSPSFLHTHSAISRLRTEMEG